MVTNEYKIAYSEVLEILNHISIEDFNKIPTDMIEMFQANASTNTDFIYNPEETLQEQNVSEIARTIIAILFRDYWATEQQHKKIVAFQNAEREKYKQELYNPDNLFKKSQKYEEVEENLKNKNMAMVEYKEPIIKRIFSKILRILHLK